MRAIPHTRAPTRAQAPLHQSDALAVLLVAQTLSSYIHAHHRQLVVLGRRWAEPLAHAHRNRSRATWWAEPNPMLL